MIGIAVIGAGHWGPNLIRNFHNGQRSTVRWVVDHDEVRLARARERFPGVLTGRDAGEALRDGSVDAVVVATPTRTHYGIAKAALDNGKHVLVEKPIATRAAEALDLCELATRVGRILMVGHVFIFNPAVQRVKQYLAGGLLGRLYYATMVRTNLGPIRVDVNAAWDLAAHDISIANYWLDESPVSVSATGGTWINAGIEDVAFATLSYASGVLVNLHVSWLSPRKVRNITLVGEQRMLTFDDMNLSEPVRIYDKGVGEERCAGYADSFASFRASIREGDILIPRVALGEPLRAECDHFVECIATGTQPLTGGREGLAVVRVLEAIERSLASGGQVERVEA